MIGSKLLPLAPRSRIANSSASANSCSVGRCDEHRQQRLERVVGDRARAPDAIDLARVLHPAQALDELARGNELDADECLRRTRSAGPSVTLCSSSPRRDPARDRAHEDLALRGAGQPDLDLRTRAGRVELLVRALRVAAVGDEARAVGAVTSNTAAEPVNPVR